MLHHGDHSSGERSRGPAGGLLAVGLAAALVTGACTGNGSGGSAAPTVGGGSISPSVAAPTKTIPQPVVTNIPVAPDSARVDISMPTFSNPTNVTNPLFPISLQESVLLLGTVDGGAFRTEVTLLPETRIIEWGGQRVEALVSQYAAFLDGRIHEIAYDFYAQADDGSVWYFGEDVFNFNDGVIADTHGTWIAGKDGPAAMIMPGDPKAGDVYRPENIPGLVFEEVTVKSVGLTLDGPFGPVEGGLAIEEVHMDGAVEDKTFGPAYGEFLTGGGGDTEAVALAVPTNALSGPLPSELETLLTGALDLFAAAGSEDWGPVSARAQEMAGAWETFRTGEVPKLIEPLMTDALDALARAVDGHDAAPTRQAAIDTARLSLDLQLRHRPAAEVDLARLDLWAAQIQVDAAARDAAAMIGDFFSIDYVRDRIMHVLSNADAVAVNLLLEELLGPVGEGRFAAAAESAGRLRETLAGIQPAS